MDTMKRGWRFWALIALISVAVAVGALTLFGPYLVYFPDLWTPNDGKNYTTADIQPTVTYLEAHAEEVPEGLFIRPAPGSMVKPGDEMCVTVVFLICGDQTMRFLPQDNRWCGEFRVRTYVDGAPAMPSDSVLHDLAQADGPQDDYYGGEVLCFYRPLSPGKHLFQVQAYPHGKKVWYSWVWTVEP